MKLDEKREIDNVQEIENDVLCMPGLGRADDVEIIFFRCWPFFEERILFYLSFLALAAAFFLLAPPLPLFPLFQ